MKNPITFKDGAYIMGMLVIFIVVTVLIWSLFGLGEVFNIFLPYYSSRVIDGFLLILLLIVVIASYIYAKVLNKK